MLELAVRAWRKQHETPLPNRYASGFFAMTRESRTPGDCPVRKSGRIDAFDVAKGIGLLLVALGHVDLSSTLSRVVYFFHMPLFFFIGGWFLPKDHDSQPMRVFLRKKTRRLLLPFGFMAVVSVCLDTARGYLKYGELGLRPVLQNVVNALYASGTVENKTPFGISSAGLIWFLPALFLSLLIVQLLIRSKRSALFQACIVAALFGVCRRSAEFVWLPFSVQAAGCAAVFVWAGHTAKRVCTEAAQRPPEENHGALLLPVLLGVPLLILESCLGLSVVAAGARYPAPVLSVCTAIVASCAVLCISYAVSRRWRCRPLSFLGRNSMIAYCAHQVGAYCFAGLQFYFPLDTDGGWRAIPVYILYMAIQTVFALTAIFVVRKAKRFFALKMQNFSDFSQKNV